MTRVVWIGDAGERTEFRICAADGTRIIFKKGQPIEIDDEFGRMVLTRADFAMAPEIELKGDAEGLKLAEKPKK